MRHKVVQVFTRIQENTFSWEQIFVWCRFLFLSSIRRRNEKNNIFFRTEQKGRSKHELLGKYVLSFSDEKPVLIAICFVRHRRIFFIARLSFSFFSKSLQSSFLRLNNNGLSTKWSRRRKENIYLVLLDLESIQKLSVEDKNKRNESSSSSSSSMSERKWLW